MEQAQERSDNEWYRNSAFGDDGSPASGSLAAGRDPIPAGEYNTFTHEAVQEPTKASRLSSVLGREPWTPPTAMRHEFADNVIDVSRHIGGVARHSCETVAAPFRYNEELGMSPAGAWVFLGVLKAVDAGASLANAVRGERR